MRQVRRPGHDIMLTAAQAFRSYRNSNMLFDRGNWMLTSSGFRLIHGISADTWRMMQC